MSGSILAISIATACSGSPGVRSLSPQAAYRGAYVYSDDDWVTFAHDYMRTGFQSRNVGLTLTNVRHLRLRWKTRIQLGGIYASPLVYNGNVIVVTLGEERRDATVYDLLAKNGSVVWSRLLGGGVRATPSIDPATNSLIVGNRLTADGEPAPSKLFAISLVDGHILWERQLNGPTHGGSVIANGVVYIGTAGGDPGSCINGGIAAIDEATGAPRWFWRVNDLQYPRGGGSNWGAIAYDGTHLVFGTGNTCYPTAVTTANGAVELTTDGNVVWNFVAVKNSRMDDDTGGGVLLSAGKAIFISKNGSLYALGDTSGNEAWTISLNPNNGEGGFATPSTDGSTIVVGAGGFPEKGTTPSQTAGKFNWRVTKPSDVMAGYTSKLFGLDESGAVRWSIPMVNRLDGYVAIVAGMGVTTLNKSIDAIDLETGHVVWEYPTSAYFEASPVIVRSGLYAADQSGNVYALDIP